jgi:hypothetical protein
MTVSPDPPPEADQTRVLKVRTLKWRKFTLNVPNIPQSQKSSQFYIKMLEEDHIAAAAYVDYLV